MTLSDIKIENDPRHVELLKALAHPIRLELLGILTYRNVSPSDFARHRGEPVGNLSYHFRCLENAGFIELVASEPSRRGSHRNIYRRTQQIVFSERDWLLMPDEARQVVASTLLRDIVGLMTEALEADTFTKRPEVHITWRPVLLDEQGWQTVDETLTEAERDVEQAQVESMQRMQQSGEPGFQATVAVISFESPKSPPAT
jgi:DNA-binding transcriptional ArsR family regulator